MENQSKTIQKPSIFSAPYGNCTAIGRKERKELYLDSCDYCEGSGRDIFYRSDVCPFCYGSLIAVYKKDGEKLITL